MRALLALVVRRRLTVAILFGIALLAGLWQLRDAPLDVLPAFAPNQVVVQTEAPGLDAEQVETLVTRPVEQALAGVAGLDTLRSESIAGLSVVTLNFGPGDPWRLRQGVTEQLASAVGQLPAGVGPPRASPLTSATMDVLKIGLVSDRVDPMTLRTLAQYRLRPQLLGVPGVARVTIYGGSIEQAQINVDPARLVANGLTLDQVEAAAARAAGVEPGGFIETPGQRLSLHTPVPQSVAALAAAPVAVRGGQVVRLGDVAQVVSGPAPAFGDALIQGRPGVLLAVSGQYGANTLAVTRLLDQRVAELGPALKAEGITLYPALHRPASFVETALANLGRALLLGGGFVLLVLLLFLRDWRAALISFVALPVSLTIAALALWSLGYALDTMTLGGFAVALGVLVDDAIIDVENVGRRLRQLPADAGLADRLVTVRDASFEIRSAMINATLVVMLVFLPVLLQSNLEGAFLRPLALAFILSVAASLLVAATLTPALAALLLARRPVPDTPAWVLRGQDWQARLIEQVAPLRNRGVALLLLAVALAAGLAARRPLEFIPDFREGHVVVQAITAQPGVSLAEARGVGEALSRALLRLPEVATVEQQFGRAEAGEDTWTPDRSELHIELKNRPGLDQAAAQDHIRAVAEGFPALRTETLTFLGDRLSESLTGETAPAVVRLSGENLDLVEQQAMRVRAALAGVPGIADLGSVAGARTPQLGLVVDAVRARALGLEPAAVAHVLRAASTGVTVGNLYHADRAVPVVVRAPAPGAGLGEGLLTLPINSPVAGLISLGDVARLAPGDTRLSIRHEDARRTATIGFGAQGRPLAAVMADARAAVARLHLPAALDVTWGGVAEAAGTARANLAIAGVAALALVLLVLAGSFRERRHVWLVLLNLPFALLGALLALLLTGLSLSLGAMVGLVTVFGISARTAILLLGHIEQLAMERGVAVDNALVLEAARDRFLPVVMTALVAALGLAPLALGADAAGNEIEGPLAIVVLGGLASSTLLGLMLLPALAARRS